jgi:trk system potassium uptake protein TrkA
MALVEALAARKVDVLAVDRDPELVKSATRHTAEAVCFSAVDEDALGRAAPAKRDMAVCAIGTDRENSIICTALLRQLGSPFVLARATDTVHERILRLVGAHEVVNPDQEFGRRLAKRLLFRGLLDAVPLGDDLSIVELRTPNPFVGKTLLEEGTRLVPPRADIPLDREDILVIVAPESEIERLAERNGQ